MLNSPRFEHLADSTAEYITGKDIVERNNIHLNGLKCVTVLIGVYDLTTGQPIMGIINQPFDEVKEDSWTGCCYWGFVTDNISKHSHLMDNPRSYRVCLSSSEDPTVKNKLRKNGYQLVEAAGAGYKILNVIAGLADAYVLTKNSTFKWDTCGPQAILKSMGGDIFVLDEALKGRYVGLSYSEDPDQESGASKLEKFCNSGGLIACRDAAIAKDVVGVLNK